MIKDVIRHVYLALGAYLPTALDTEESGDAQLSAGDLLDIPTARLYVGQRILQVDGYPHLEIIHRGTDATDLLTGYVDLAHDVDVRVSVQYTDEGLSQTHLQHYLEAVRRVVQDYIQDTISGESSPVFQDELIGAGTPVTWEASGMLAISQTLTFRLTEREDRPS